MNWQTLRKITSFVFVCIGIVLTIYIAFSAFGFVKNSSEHYSTFILGICLMTGFLAIRNLCDERLGLTNKMSETGEERKPKRFFWPRFVFANFALIGAAVGMGFVRINAVYLEQNQPFFSDRDMICLLYTSPSPRDGLLSRMPSSA